MLLLKVFIFTVLLYSIQSTKENYWNWQPKIWWLKLVMKVLIIVSVFVSSVWLPFHTIVLTFLLSKVAIKLDKKNGYFSCIQLFTAFLAYLQMDYLNKTFFAPSWLLRIILNHIHDRCTVIIPIIRYYCFWSIKRILFLCKQW